MQPFLPFQLYTAAPPDVNRENLMLVERVFDLRDPPPHKRPWWRGPENPYWPKDFLRWLPVIQFIDQPIPRGQVLLDSGRKCKDKHATIKQLCRRIVNELRQGNRVLLICNDGQSTSGYVALVCRGWFLDWKGATVEDLCKWRRDEGDFTTARSKEQRAQMGQVLKYAREIETCPFIPKEKK